MIEIRHVTETRDAYNELFTSEAIHQMDSLFLWVYELLAIRPKTQLLDIATGRGQMVEWSRKKGTLAFGIDFSLTACLIANQQSQGNFSSADGQKLPFADDQFDFVTNIGSLEHFENMSSGVREMVRVMKPGGKACLMVPNTFGLRWNVMHSWQKGDVSDDGQPLQRYGTRRQWETLFHQNGLKVLKVLGYEHERAYPRTRKDIIGYLKSPKRLLSFLFMTPFIPVNAAGQFVFICTTQKEAE